MTYKWHFSNFCRFKLLEISSKMVLTLRTAACKVSYKSCIIALVVLKKKERIIIVARDSAGSREVVKQRCLVRPYSRSCCSSWELADERVAWVIYDVQYDPQIPQGQMCCGVVCVADMYICLLYTQQCIPVCAAYNTMMISVQRYICARYTPAHVMFSLSLSLSLSLCLCSHAGTREISVLSLCNSALTAYSSYSWVHLRFTRNSICTSDRRLHVVWFYDLVSTTVIKDYN